MKRIALCALMLIMVCGCADGSSIDQGVQEKEQTTEGESNPEENIEDGDAVSVDAAGDEVSKYELITFRYQQHPVVVTCDGHEVANISYTTINTESYEDDGSVHQFFLLANRLKEFNNEQKQKYLEDDNLISNSENIRDHVASYGTYSYCHKGEIIPIRSDNEVFSFVVYEQLRLDRSTKGWICWWPYNIDSESGEDILLSDVVTDTEPLLDILFEEFEKINIQESLPAESRFGFKRDFNQYIINRSGDFIADEHVLKILTGEKYYNELLKREGKYANWVLDYDGVWFFFSGDDYEAYGVKIRYNDHPEIFSDRFFKSNLNGDISFQALEKPEANIEYEDLLMFEKKDKMQEENE